MSETEAYDRVLSCVMNHPLNREALIEILRYCEQERDQADVEAHMQAPSAAYSALLSPYRLICQLVDAGGIVCTEVDADGEPVTDDRRPQSGPFRGRARRPRAGLALRNHRCRQ